MVEMKPLRVSVFFGLVVAVSAAGALGLPDQGGHGEVQVISLVTNDTADNFPAQRAGFGPDFPGDGLEGRLVYADPIYACGKINNKAPAKIDKYGWILLISRGGNCQFADKVITAQRYNYTAAIVHNDNKTIDCNRQLTIMGGVNGSQVQIPSVFVGCLDGARLASLYTYQKGPNYILQVSAGANIDYKMYLWPFAIVVAACFILVMVFLLIKFVRDHARVRNSRLSNKHLKKIPVRKFKKGDYYDTCAICLDEYEEGEKIRVLPCDHVYHTKCIDPWLTKSKKTCPVCKRRVIPGRDGDSDSDSDDNSGSSAANTSENTPLLGAQASSSRSSVGSQYGAEAPAPAQRMSAQQPLPPVVPVTSVVQTRAMINEQRIRRELEETDQLIEETEKLLERQQRLERRRRRRRQREAGGEETAGEPEAGPSTRQPKLSKEERKAVRDLNSLSPVERQLLEEQLAAVNPNSRKRKRAGRAERKKDAGQAQMPVVEEEPKSQGRVEGERKKKGTKGNRKRSEEEPLLSSGQFEDEDGFVSAQSSFREAPVISQKEEEQKDDDEPLLGAVGGADLAGSRGATGGAREEESGGLAGGGESGGATTGGGGAAQEDYINPSYSEESQEVAVASARRKGAKKELNQLV